MDPRDILTDTEQAILRKAMIRGLLSRGRKTYTEGDLQSVLLWAARKKLQWTILQLVLAGKTVLVPDPDGDPEKVLSAAAQSTLAGDFVECPAESLN